MTIEDLPQSMISMMNLPNDMRETINVCVQLAYNTGLADGLHEALKINSSLHDIKFEGKECQF